MLCKWYEGWNQNPPALEILSKTGLIIPDLGAVFLYKTDSTLCLAENLITNRDYRKEDRNYLIDKLIDEVFLWAKKMNFKQIISFAESQLVINRLTKNHQYKVANKYKLLVKEL